MTNRAGRQALKTVASALDALRRPARGLVVLAYHRVGTGSGLDVDLDVDLFTRQMAELAERRVVTLDDGLDAVAAPTTRDTPAGSDPVVVTFDDGTADFADAALPILVRFGVPATVYVATRFVDEGTAFPGAGRPLSWPALRDCLATGLVTVGSHTHAHALLDRIPDDIVDGELDRSIDLIREHLGVDPAHFAYPKGLPGTPAARAAVASRFRSAALAGTRPNPYGRTDPQRLMRSPIQASDAMRWFRSKAGGGMATEDDLRRLLNRWRYSRATS